MCGLQIRTCRNLPAHLSSCSAQTTASLQRVFKPSAFLSQGQKRTWSCAGTQCSVTVFRVNSTALIKSELCAYKETRAPACSLSSQARSRTSFTGHSHCGACFCSLSGHRPDGELRSHLEERKWFPATRVDRLITCIQRKGNGCVEERPVLLC